MFRVHEHGELLLRFSDFLQLFPPCVCVYIYSVPCPCSFGIVELINKWASDLHGRFAAGFTVATVSDLMFSPRHCRIDSILSQPVNCRWNVRPKPLASVPCA